MATEPDELELVVRPAHNRTDDLWAGYPGDPPEDPVDPPGSRKGLQLEGLLHIWPNKDARRLGYWGRGIEVSTRKLKEVNKHRLIRLAERCLRQENESNPEACGELVWQWCPRRAPTWGKP